MRPAPGPKPKILQHPSLLCQLCPAHGRCMPLTSLPWKELTTWYVVTSIQRWSLSDFFHLARATLSKSSRCSKKCSQNTEFLKYFTLDNGPQYGSTQFTEFCTSWGITHETSSPHYPQSNGFTEACVKSMKHALQCTKYSGTNPQLTLLTLRATPINVKLLSPAELLYQCQIRTTIPARICNTDLAALQIQEWIDVCSDASKSQADKWCKSLAPLSAGQPVAMYDTICKIWIPATVVHVLPKDSYEVCTSNGMVYCCTWWHLCEHSVKPLTPPQMSQQPHCRLLPDLTFLHHCLHLPSLHNCNSLCLMHLQWLQLQNHRHQLSLKSPLCLHLCLQHPA